MFEKSLSSKVVEQLETGLYFCEVGDLTSSCLFSLYATPVRVILGKILSFVDKF